jgi:hypothetical protein
LSICLHNTVSSTLGKVSTDDYSQMREYTIDDLPELTRENLFQPEFWSTMYLNTTIGKDKVLREWVKETIRILKKGKRIEEAELVSRLSSGDFGCFLPNKVQDFARKRYLRNTIQSFQKEAGIRTLSRDQEFSRLGKSLRSRATRKRVRILSRKDPSGKTRRASRNLQ